MFYSEIVITCGFEASDAIDGTCDFSIAQNPWQPFSGPTPTPLTGPSVDRTTQTPQGWSAIKLTYMLVTTLVIDNISCGMCFTL